MQTLPRVFDQKDNLIGYSYYCSWCSRCGPSYATEDLAMDAYLAHQDSSVCKEVEKENTFLVKQAFDDWNKIF